MDKHPVVTAIIPCHNHERWVWSAVESVAKQEYPCRIVVVDDGSSDFSHQQIVSRIYKPSQGTANGLDGSPTAWLGRLKDYGHDVAVLRYEKANGPSSARNAGMKFAWDETDIFALLDSDDFYEQGKLSLSVAKFLESDAVGVVYSDYDTLNIDTGVRIREYKEPYDRFRLMRECIVNCDSLVSKKAIETVGGFDPMLRCAEDWDMWLRISESFMLSHIPQQLVTLRVGSHSSTANVKSEVWQACWRRVMEKLQQRSAK